MSDTHPLPWKTLASGKRYIVLGGFLALVGFFTALAVHLTGNSSPPRSGQAPDFRITTFDGDTMHLSDLRGQVVLLHFWGSWCAPCRAEALILQSLYEQYEDQGMVILGVAYRDTEAESRAFIEEYGLTYPNGLDVGETISEQLYGIRGAPTTFVIDPNGDIALYHLGPIDEAFIASTVDGLLAKT